MNLKVRKFKSEKKEDQTNDILFLKITLFLFGKYKK